MTQYTVRYVRGDFELADDKEIVGIAKAVSADYAVLVRLPDTGDDTHLCGYPIDEDEERYCTREVDGPDDYCWQHEDND